MSIKIKMKKKSQVHLRLIEDCHQEFYFNSGWTMTFMMQKIIHVNKSSSLGYVRVWVVYSNIACACNRL